MDCCHPLYHIHSKVDKAAAFLYIALTVTDVHLHRAIDACVCHVPCNDLLHHQGGAWQTTCISPDHRDTAGAEPELASYEGLED